MVLASKLLCVSIAPFANPVVPPVYWSAARSSPASCTSTLLLAGDLITSLHECNVASCRHSFFVKRGSARLAGRLLWRWLFCFSDPAATEIYTLALHDPLRWNRSG